MAGPKTHEQFKRTLEHEPDIDAPVAPARPKHVRDNTRNSEFPVSRQGVNQESEHNKHNHPARGAPKH